MAWEKILEDWNYLFLLLAGFVRSSGTTFSYFWRDSFGPKCVPLAVLIDSTAGTGLAENDDFWVLIALTLDNSGLCS